MWTFIGAAVDLIHALVLILWIIGLPLLFWQRFPSLSRFYAVFAVIFIILSQGGQMILGECFLTTIARICYLRGGMVASGEWFTVRFAYYIFRLIPSHHLITYLFETIIIIYAIGLLFLIGRKYWIGKKIARS